MSKPSIEIEVQRLKVVSRMTMLLINLPTKASLLYEEKCTKLHRKTELTPAPLRTVQNFDNNKELKFEERRHYCDQQKENCKYVILCQSRSL